MIETHDGVIAVKVKLSIMVLIVIVTMFFALIIISIIPPEPPQKILKGFSLSPKSFRSEDLTTFFENVEQTSEVLSWVGDWRELSETENSGSEFIVSYASSYDYIPIVEVQFFNQATGELLRPLNESIKEEYMNSAISFVEEFKPRYFGVGVEVNVLYERSPSDFNIFVDFYNELYSSLKSVSSETLIFTVFQLEKMKGLNGGLFGGVNNVSITQWFLIDSFHSLDLIVFTTYPSLIFQDPSDIPSDYYSDINAHTDALIAFSELGWHTSDSVSGWESSEGEQAEFLEAYFELIEDLDVEFIIWSFMYDPETFEPFGSMGLFDRDSGNSKSAWQVWLEFQ